MRFDLNSFRDQSFIDQYAYVAWWMSIPALVAWTTILIYKKRHTILELLHVTSDQVGHTIQGISWKCRWIVWYPTDLNEPNSTSYASNSSTDRAGYSTKSISLKDLPPLPAQPKEISFHFDIEWEEDQTEYLTGCTGRMELSFWVLRDIIGIAKLDVAHKASFQWDIHTILNSLQYDNFIQLDDLDLKQLQTRITELYTRIKQSISTSWDSDTRVLIYILEQNQMQMTIAFNSACRESRR